SADVICGISASGGAPCVLGFLQEGKNRGAAAIGLCTNPGAPLADYCDVIIAPRVGPEVLTGSTRMKSGTAQKMVLNMLTTCSMIRLGKAYGNMMVDLVATNQKLKNALCV
ncbi:MAG: SIS domain-containing protein, partial [Clostridia bacterium]|nr:SIS domain-containing protein [Clostridia bacterium]